MEPDASKNKIGIVILNWNGWQDTVECVNSIQYSWQAPYQFEIVIIDNGSTDGSIDQLRLLHDVTLISHPSNEGYAHANNEGIRYVLSKGCQHILIVNNDVIATPGFFSPLLKVLVESPDAGIVCPKIKYHDKPDLIWYAGGKYKFPRMIGVMIGQNERDDGSHDKSQIVDFAVGCCMLISREVFDQIGYFDDRFFAYEEDIDFSYRATQAGFIIWYQPESTILHKVSHSTKENIPFRAFLQAKSRILFFHKHIHGVRLIPVVFLESVRLLRILFVSTITGNLQIGRNYLKGIYYALKEIY